MAVELALTPDSRWNIDTEGLVRAARDAGFSALGMPAGRADPAAAQALASAGLRCHELMALVVSDDAAATVSAARRLAEAATVMGARWVNTVFQVGLTAETAQVIERCAAIFAEAGTGMAVEFSPAGAVPSIRDGLRVMAAAGPGRAGLLIDTWHFFRGDSTWQDLAEVPLEQIAYIQFCDALPPESDNLMRETLHRRVMPGDGVFELEQFASTLLDRGFAGPVSVEVLSRDLRELPVPDFARRAFEASSRYWS
jgi:sugar phosphate isomerase/epimerase